MRIPPTSKSKFARLGRPALAAAVLALAASASYATAVVRITSFSVTTDGNFVTPKYAVASGQSSTLSVEAKDGGGATASDFLATDWNDSANVTALTSSAFAVGNVISFTDGLTALQTGGFNLQARATGLSALASTALAAGEQSGGFTLVDGDLAAVAGSLTFDVFYDLIVTTDPGDTPPLDSSSETFVAFSASDFDDEDGSLFDMLATSALSPDSAKSGQFTLTFALDAGQSVFYSLAGTAAASAVPEPTSIALALVGLFAAGASRRKSRLKA